MIDLSVKTSAGGPELALREQAAFALADAFVRLRPSVAPLGDRTFIRFYAEDGDYRVSLSVKGSLASDLKSRFPIEVYEIGVRFREPNTSWIGRLLRLKVWGKTEHRLNEPLDITEACLKILIELREETERGADVDKAEADDRIIAKLIEALKLL